MSANVDNPGSRQLSGAFQTRGGGRPWLLAFNAALLAAGYLRLEANQVVLGRVTVIALVIVLAAALAYFAWTSEWLKNPRGPGDPAFDSFWAQLKEQRRREWALFEERGRAYFVWFTARTLIPLLFAPFFAVLVLVGPDHLQIGRKPPLTIGFWETVAAALLPAVAIAIVRGIRNWDRAKRSWADELASPHGEPRDQHRDAPEYLSFAPDERDV